jgi:pimeloyl-ACP methyl ester carboxylesterase
MNGAPAAYAASNQTLYFVNPIQLAFLVGGASGESATLAHLNLKTALQKTKPSSARAASMAADATAATIVLLNTGGNHSLPVQFTATNASLLSYDPTLWAKNPAPGTASLQVPAASFIQVGSAWYAAAWLQAPPDGQAQLTESIKVTARQGTSSVSGTLALYPPPVLLLHGLWGDETSLLYTQVYLAQQTPYKNLPLTALPDYLFASTYSGDARFDSTTTVDHVITEIENQRDAVTLVAGIVAARVDVVAHSMGGLVSRSLTTASGYSSVHTRNLGAIHQIVTLDTPEIGSQLATFLIAHENDTPISDQFIWSEICGRVTDTVAQCFAYLGDPIGGAVQSLQPTDKGLLDAPNPNLPNAIWRAVTAQAPKNAVLSALIDLLIKSFVAPPAPTINSILGTPDNDAIVTVSSQHYGHANIAGQVAYLRGLAHTDVPFVSLFSTGYSSASVIHSPLVNSYILCWLTTAGSTACPGSNAAPELVSQQQPTPSLLGTRAVAAHLVARATSTEIGGSLRVDIGRPGARTVFVAQHDDAGNIVADEELPVSPSSSGRAGIEIVPKLLGNVSFSVQVYFADGSSSHDVITVPVSAGHDVTFFADRHFAALRLRLATARYRLTPVVTAPGLDQPAHVAGHVDYAVVSGKGVADVQPDGTVIGLAPGSARIEARLGDFEDVIEVTVE